MSYHYFYCWGLKARETFQNPPSGEPSRERRCLDSGYLGYEGGFKANEEKLAAVAQGTAGRNWTYWVLTAHPVAILALLLRKDYIPQPPLQPGVANKR